MERNTAIRTLHETKLKVRLVFFDIVHELPYEGPCRFGKGPELEREFDEMINQEAYKGIQVGTSTTRKTGASPKKRWRSSVSDPKIRTCTLYLLPAGPAK